MPDLNYTPYDNVIYEIIVIIFCFYVVNNLITVETNAILAWIGLMHAPIELKRQKHPTDWRASMLWK